MVKEYPILEFDPSKSAVVEPSKMVKYKNIPQNSVICFFNDVMNDLYDKGVLTKITELRSEIGTHPIYEMSHGGRKVTVFHPGVGAPLAAGMLEEVIALGSTKFIGCGGAGVLDKSIALGHILIPFCAVRDEGTSYHYMEPSREVELDSRCVDTVCRILENHRTKYRKVKTWTTDAIYRETVEKVKTRREEGCLTVEMECSALAAVCRFRGVKYAHILYAGDDVSCEVWDSRAWHTKTEIREQVFLLAVEASLDL